MKIKEKGKKETKVDKTKQKWRIHNLLSLKLLFVLQMALVNNLQRRNNNDYTI